VLSGWIEFSGVLNGKEGFTESIITDEMVRVVSCMIVIALVLREDWLSRRVNERSFWTQEDS